MSSHNLRIWALIQAALVNVEAMKAENQRRINLGKSIAYDEASFQSAEEEIRRLAESFEA